MSDWRNATRSARCVAVSMNPRMVGFLLGLSRPIPWLGPPEMVTSPGSVVVDGIFECGHAPVVHVRRRYRNIPERWRLELSDIPRVARHLVEPGVEGRDTRVHRQGCTGRCCETRPPWIDA